MANRKTVNDRFLDLQDFYANVNAAATSAAPKNAPQDPAEYIKRVQRIKKYQDDHKKPEKPAEMIVAAQKAASKKRAAAKSARIETESDTARDQRIRNEKQAKTLTLTAKLLRMTPAQRNQYYHEQAIKDQNASAKATAKRHAKNPPKTKAQIAQDRYNNLTPAAQATYNLPENVERRRKAAHARARKAARAPAVPERVAQFPLSGNRGVDMPGDLKSIDSDGYQHQQLRFGEDRRANMKLSRSGYQDFVDDENDAKLQKALRDAKLI